MYCFRWQPSEFDGSLTRQQGWTYFDLATEFLRMGVPNDEWQPTNQNNNYALCETYPQCLFVPRKATPHMVLASSRFRSRGRLPVLSYLHRFNKAAIVRCAQPLVGFSARCKEDEDLLQVIKEANPGSDYVWVVDTRPQVNAVGNKLAGKGYETTDKYTSMRFKFAPIENIHVMRSSLAKLVEALGQQQQNSVSDFTSKLQQSGWLRHLQLLLETGAFIADQVQRGFSVLIHCSDGWDRTAQTTALAQILLDPYYRTLHGFQMLIEKDFLAFGHKFTDRCGHLDGSSVTNGSNFGPAAASANPSSATSGSSTSNNMSANGAVRFSALASDTAQVSLSTTSSSSSSSPSGRHEMSPVFMQFLDCVYQLMRQHPSAFQFNERLLIELHEESHSCRFGTFVGNCEKDRCDLRLSERSHSFWGYVQQHLSDYTNCHYDRDAAAVQTKRLQFSSYSRDLSVWRNLYCRFENAILPRESQVSLNFILEPLMKLKNVFFFLNFKVATADCMLEHNAALEASVFVMQEQLTNLCRQLGKSEDHIQRKLQGIVSSQSALQLSQLFPSSFGLSHSSTAASSLGNAGGSKLESISESSHKNSQDDGDEDEDEYGDYSNEKKAPVDFNIEGDDGDENKEEVQVEPDDDGDITPTATEYKRLSIESEIIPANPLINPDKSSEKLVNLQNSLTLFAVDWQPLRKAIHCNGCRAAFSGMERKRHCWHCGSVFCWRCLRPSPAPCKPPSAINSNRVVFIGGPSACKNCLRNIVTTSTAQNASTPNSQSLHAVPS